MLPQISRYGHVELNETVHGNRDGDGDDDSDLYKKSPIMYVSKVLVRITYRGRETYVDVTPARGKGVGAIPADVVEDDSH